MEIPGIRFLRAVKATFALRICHILASVAAMKNSVLYVSFPVVVVVKLDHQTASTLDRVESFRIAPPPILKPGELMVGFR